MTANTPAQGFIYPVPSDRPCDYPATMATLAGQLEVKQQSFDTDVARLVKRKFVKASRSSFGMASGSHPVFDTIEANNGTPTDLTVTPDSIALSAGHWLLLAKLIIPTSNSGQNLNVEVSSGNSTGGISLFNFGAATFRDYGATFSPSTLNCFATVFAATGATARVRISLTWSGGATSLNISYASLAGWWLADA